MGLFSNIFGGESAPQARASGNINGHAEMVIDGVFAITGRGVVVTGKISSGSIKVKDKAKIKHNDGTVIETIVTGIEKDKTLLNVAYAGDSVGVLCGGVTPEQVSVGDVISTN